MPRNAVADQEKIETNDRVKIAQIAKSFVELVSSYRIDRTDVTPSVEYADRLQFNASNEIIILRSHKRADTYERPENKQRIRWTLPN